MALEISRLKRRREIYASSLPDNRLNKECLAVEQILVATMDRGKRPVRSLAARNNKIYMDLKDIIRENALPFIPAKSLFRFNAVCRDWRLQISSPFFAHNQSLSCRSTSGLFLQKPGGSPSLIPIDANSCGVPDPFLSFLPEPVEIRSSANGLLCCQGLGGHKAYYICNPVTQQWKKLPKSNANHGSDSAIVLLFEPSLLNFVAEYRIICAFQSADFGDAIEFDIYSSKGDSWEVAGEISFGARKVIPKSGVHVNGVVYWLTTTGGILAFDLTKERSQLLQNYDTRGALGGFSGKLCKVNVSSCSAVLNTLDNVHTNTMTMGSNTRMWSAKQSIVFDCKSFEDLARDYSVLLVDSTIMVVQGYESTYVYDFKSRSTKPLGSSDDFRNTRFLSYVNSLVSL